MLDHLFRLLGYVPATSSRLVSEASALAETPLPPHRTAAASFNFRAAGCDELCFSYDDGEDVFSYAVGRDGWAPLAIAGLALGPDARSAAILEAAVVARLWADGPAVRSWVAANARAFAAMRECEDPAFAVMARPTNADDFECDVIPRLSAVEMGAEFVRAWQRARAAYPVLFLVNSPAQIALARHHTNLAATDAASYALERCAIWLAVWFESHGMPVDRERKLVKIEGYEALFYSAYARYLTHRAPFESVSLHGQTNAIARIVEWHVDRLAVANRRPHVVIGETVCGDYQGRAVLRADSGNAPFDSIGGRDGEIHLIAVSASRLDKQ